MGEEELERCCECGDEDEAEEMESCGRHYVCRSCVVYSEDGDTFGPDCLFEYVCAKQFEDEDIS